MAFGLLVINPTTQAASLYILPGIAIGVTGSAFLMTASTLGEKQGSAYAAAPDAVARGPAMVRRGALDSAQRK